MATVKRGQSGCRVVVMAGQYLSKKSHLALPNGLQPRGGAGDAPRGASRVAQKTETRHFSVAGGAKANVISRDVKAFLSQVGANPREARYWLAQFQRATSSPFAVVEV